MKALVITGSRADRNCQEMVHEALLKAGHDSTLKACDGRSMLTALGQKPDVAVVAGDRIEVLCATLALAADRIPICHISGGDVTEGSADDRYRDAITALACIHCAETKQAHERLIKIATKPCDIAYLTGNPALDRIRQTTPEPGPIAALMSSERLNVLVSVHPNTGGGDPCVETNAIIAALKDMRVNVLPLEPNKDPGNELVSALLFGAFHRLISNREPAEYYWLMQQCDVMVGNSSAMLCEAPMFNLPCLLFGHRQDGRPLPANVLRYMDQAMPVDSFNWAFRYDRSKPVVNPYGDGHSAPRVVKALEDNAWRWTKTTS